MSAEDAHRDRAERAASYLKAELKRANVTYDELASRLNAKGREETKASIEQARRGYVERSFYLIFVTSLESMGNFGLELEDI